MQMAESTCFALTLTTSHIERETPGSVGVLFGDSAEVDGDLRRKDAWHCMQYARISFVV